MILYHYSCADNAPLILDSGYLEPTMQPLLDPSKFGPFLWLTDLAEPDADGLGLTSNSLACDRTAFRFAVDGSPARHWFYQSVFFPRAYVHALEAAPGAAPGHWYIADRKLKVLQWARVTPEG